MENKHEKQMNELTMGGIYTGCVWENETSRFFHFPYQLWFCKLKGRSLNDRPVNALV